MPGMTSWFGRLGLLRSLLTDARLAWRLVREPRVPAACKAVPVLAALYLLSPIDVGTMSLRNRVMMPPHTAPLGPLWGSEAEAAQNIEYIRRRCEAGVSWIVNITGHIDNLFVPGFTPVGIGARTKGYFRLPVFHDRVQAYTEAIHGAGSFTTVQLVSQGGPVGRGTAALHLPDPFLEIRRRIDDPDHPPSHLAAIGRLAAPGCRVVGAQHFGDSAGVVGGEAGAGHEERTAQAHLSTGCEPVVLRRCLRHEVVGLDVEIAGELDLTSAVGFVLGVVLQCDRFHQALGPVGDAQTDRSQDCHASQCRAVEFVADERLEQLDGMTAVGLGDTDERTEVADGTGRVTATTQRLQRGKARVVPAKLLNNAGIIGAAAFAAD